MKPRRSVALAVLIPALLAVALVVAACGSEETTTAATRAVTITTQAVTTTTHATTTTTDSGEAMFKGDLQRTGVFESGGPSQKPDLVWVFQTSGAVGSSPAISDGVVYFGTSDNYLYALDIQTGQENWKFQAGGLVHSSPAISDGVVCVGSMDAYLYAVDAESGMEKWRFQTGDAVGSSPAISDGVVYFGSNDGYLYAADALTGHEKWKFQTGGWVESSPAISDGVVYQSSSDGCLYAVDAESGTEKWTFQAERPDHVFRSSVAISDGVVCVTYAAPSRYGGVDDCSLYTVDSQSGKEKWEFQGLNLTAPAILDEVVYVGSASVKVEGFDYVMLGEDRLYALDRQSGTEKWKFPVDSSGAMLSPSISGGVAYFLGSNYLFAVDITTGEELWKWGMPGGVMLGTSWNSSPAISGGVVYSNCIDLRGGGGYVYGVK
jgi:outer membrane protein assembly factor BamB